MRNSIFSFSAMFATALLVLFIQSFKPADLGKEVLPAGTRLDLVLRSNIDSETASQGNMIDFKVRTRITSANGIGCMVPVRLFLF